MHGEVVLDPRFLTTTVDLLALENGGRLLDTSDAFYASPENLILPSRARTTGEGWENARRRGPGNDWATFALAARGEPTLVEVDTSFFIGNAPGSVRVQAADAVRRPVDDGAWWDVVPETPVLVDTRHQLPRRHPPPGDAPAARRLPRRRADPAALLRRDRRGRARTCTPRFFDALPAEHRAFPRRCPSPRPRPARRRGLTSVSVLRTGPASPVHRHRCTGHALARGRARQVDDR